MIPRTMRPIVVILAIYWGVAAAALSASSSAVTGNAETLMAGAAQVDITPQELPVIVSGYFFERTSATIRDRLYARALVLDDGASRIAICVVDTLFMPRDLLDEVKRVTSRSTGIGLENILISATHTHSAPSVAGALGTGVDEGYRKFLPPKIVEAIQQANDRLEPARVGWTVTDAPDHTHCRRWILRPDKIRQDVFGQSSVRADMHPGYQNPDFIGPTSPADTELSLLAVQSRRGRPMAVLANYSMHYFGSSDVSADYFGRFAEKFAELIGAANGDPPFVAAMSQGTSGDLHWYDYSRPRESVSMEAYSESLARLASKAYEGIVYREACSLGMLERKLTLQRRTPDEARLSWARGLVEKMEGRKPKTRPEVYAREQVSLHEDPVRELKLQVIRIGELGITAIPCEVYGITGLKIKAQSPVRHTFNIELANGSEGYIPPPEQHLLGGYTTWPARSAALETGAEPRIVEALLAMLEEVSDAKRRPLQAILSPYDKAVLKSEPLAYWPLDEIQGSRAADLTSQGNHASYEGPVALYLPGPVKLTNAEIKGLSRSAHFAGGRVKARLPKLGRRFSVELWMWNGLPADARPFTGFFFSRAFGGRSSSCVDRLGIGGTFNDSAAKGKLIFCPAKPEENMVAGTSEIPLRTWSHVVLVREDARLRVYLNGNKTPEINTDVQGGQELAGDGVMIGGCDDSKLAFEGRIAKAALFDRSLSPGEIARHYRAGVGHRVAVQLQQKQAKAED